MSILGPRGRHRAPSKLSTTFNSTARVSATVAVAGGLVASVAAPQVAHATGVASISGASSVDFAAQSARTHALAHPLAATRAQQQLGAVTAQPELAPSVPAKSFIVQPKPVVRPRTVTVSRAVTRPVVTHVTTPKAAPVTQPAPAAPAAASGIVAIAERYLGTPYVYGGDSPSGFDCSGFTSYVYGLAGTSIPRTATAQMLASTRVSTPQPGDLVFFGSGSYAYHVGIYIGNGMMIDAPKPGDSVKIQSVYTTPVAYGRF